MILLVTSCWVSCEGLASHPEGVLCRKCSIICSFIPPPMSWNSLGKQQKKQQTNAINNDVIFQTPFQRLVKRMTRFHTKKTPDKTLYKLKEVLDNLKYNFTVNSPHQVRISTFMYFFHAMITSYLIHKINVFLQM